MWVGVEGVGGGSRVHERVSPLSRVLIVLP